MASELILTRKGVEELEKKLEHLKSVRRIEVAEQIKVARSFGDLSENAEYDEARNAQSLLEGQILDIENMLKLAVIVDEDEIGVDVVGIGTKVRILDIDNNEEETYRILGTVEANPALGNISNESPVGNALLGAKIGDQVSVDVPSGTLHFKVLEIGRAELPGSM